MSRIQTFATTGASCESSTPLAAAAAAAITTPSLPFRSSRRRPSRRTITRRGSRTTSSCPPASSAASSTIPPTTLPRSRPAFVLAVQATASSTPARIGGHRWRAQQPLAAPVQNLVLAVDFTRSCRVSLARSSRVWTVRADRTLI